MKFWTGVTDNEWFAFLSERKLDKVNLLTGRQASVARRRSWGGSISPALVR